jgi:voltage-gated potassium channel
MAKSRSKAGSSPALPNLSYFARLLNQTARHPFLAIVALLVALVIFGVSGYMLIEDWPFADALYMTVITMTTIGYGEVRTLSPGGRIFTIILIAVGVITATYAITATIELLTSQEFVQQIRNRRRRRTLEQIHNHSIICGYGRLGRNLAGELRAQNIPLIIIDVDPDVVQRCRDSGFHAVHGSAADELVLEEAGIQRAKSLVAAAKSDAENVFIVLTARSVNPKLQIVARSNNEATISKLEKAGADKVIFPYAITGRRIANMLVRPNVIDFLDGVLEFGDQRVRIEEFIINENSPLAGLTLLEAKLKVAVVAVDHPGQTVNTHPNASTRLLPGTAIIAMGVEEELAKLAELVS